ncbi:MATE family efflux transporter [Butyrivibrio sp. FCS014]|uniref:MATE family efflux transporter n=1 Tax=Butyrivibrio sp. FCS014 TaxID=1408304 RepID=UPI000465B56A|nr:MATE family efflux transporter [Butyrivibrio sp. FCS014]
MRSTGKIDMTTGPIMGNIMMFALPIVLGNILQYLYTTVDTLVIGHYCDYTAIAAVGTSSQPIEVLLCIFLGIGTGVSILISQHTGADDALGVRNACKTAISFVYLCGIPISIIGWFAAPLILRFMDVPPDVWDNALLYTRIVLCGAIGNIGYNMNAGILRGLGDSRASLYFLVVSTVVNIVLDITLVGSLELGVAGVALATGIAMFLAWIVSIIYIMRRYPELEFTLFPRTIIKSELKKIMTIGLPIGLNNSLFSFGHVALQTLINAEGSVFMAGWSIAGRVTGLANMAITGISSAATTYSGQNFGAGRIDRLRQGQVIIPFANGAITLGFGLIFILLRYPILGLFTDEAGVLALAGRNVVIMLSCQWMYAVFNAISCIVNGTGRVKYTTLINLMMLWAVRIPSAYLISRFIAGRHLMFCFPISFGFGMLCMIGYFLFSPSWRALMRTSSLQKG